MPTNLTLQQALQESKNAPRGQREFVHVTRRRLIKSSNPSSYIPYFRDQSPFERMYIQFHRSTRVACCPPTESNLVVQDTNIYTFHTTYFVRAHYTGYPPFQQ